MMGVYQRCPWVFGVSFFLIAAGCASTIGKSGKQKHNEVAGEVDIRSTKIEGQEASGSKLEGASISKSKNVRKYPGPCEIIAKNGLFEKLRYDRDDRIELIESLKEDGETVSSKVRFFYSETGQRTVEIVDIDADDHPDGVDIAVYNDRDDVIVKISMSVGKYFDIEIEEYLYDEFRNWKKKGKNEYFKNKKGGFRKNPSKWNAEYDYNEKGIKQVAWIDDFSDGTYDTKILFKYDQRGFLVEERTETVRSDGSWELNDISRYHYDDEANKVREELYLNSDGSGGVEKQYEYDEFGNLEKETLDVGRDGVTESEFLYRYECWKQPDMNAGSNPEDN